MLQERILLVSESNLSITMSSLNRREFVIHILVFYAEKKVWPKKMQFKGISHISPFIFSVQLLLKNIPRRPSPP